jgi:hypothetical protein
MSQERAASGAQDGRVMAHGLQRPTVTEPCDPLAEMASESISGEVAANLPPPTNVRGVICAGDRACPYPPTQGSLCARCARMLRESRFFEQRTGFEGPSEHERQKFLNRLNMREYRRNQKLMQRVGKAVYSHSR